MKIITSIITLVIILSCGVPQADYDKLKAENETLKSELDECRFGSEKIAAAVEKAYNEKNYSLARQNIELLYSKHPESPKNKEFKQLLKKIEKKEIEEKKRKDAEEKERIRLANINNTGMWSVRYYVDEFGEPTKQGYITNTTSIKGVFSNTATQGSKLNVDFLINSYSKISIKLYEYAGNNPVKSNARMWDSYEVLMQDKDGKRLELKARNSSDRLTFDKTYSRKLHKALMKGGKVKFRIRKIGRWTTQYEFTIQKADWYDNAYRKLK